MVHQTHKVRSGQCPKWSAGSVVLTLLSQDHVGGRITRAYLQLILNFWCQAWKFCWSQFGQLWLSNTIMNTISPTLEILWFPARCIRRWPWMIYYVSQHDLYICWGFVKTELSLLPPNLGKFFQCLTAKFCWFGQSVSCRYALLLVFYVLTKNYSVLTLVCTPTCNAHAVFVTWRILKNWKAASFYNI
jgi:hypothetical protein